MRRHRAWLLYAAAWLPFAAGWASLVWLSRQSLGFSILAAVAMMGMAALLSLGVWQASARHPWPEPGHGSRAEFIVRVVFAGLGYAIVLAGLDSVLGGAFEGRTANSR